MLEEMKDVTPAGDVTVVIAVQEEVGSRGARVAARRARPDYALVLDTFMAGDTPDVTSTRRSRLGSGAVPSSCWPAATRVLGQLIHPAVKRWMIQTAERIGMPYQPATMVGISFTDSSVIHLAREGIPTGGLGLARRYSHSPVEMLDLNDAAHAVRFLRAFVEDMPGHGDLGFLGK